MTTGAGADLAERVAALGWYHTIDLGNGIVTDGSFDTRPTVARVGLPDSLAGRRCLDVGTWDGFWAFELERRGADEVVAVDVLDAARWDWPPHDAHGAKHAQLAVLEDVKGAGEAFELAREALGSKVDRRDLSIYDLAPETTGSFDFVFLGSLLLHLRDPVAALAALRGVCSGRAIITDSIELVPTLLRPRTPTARLEGIGKPWWWQPNAAALAQMVKSAGWIVESKRLYFLPTGKAHPRLTLSRIPQALLSAAGREQVIINTLGIPHLALRVRPQDG